MRLDPRLHGERIEKLEEELRGDVVGQESAIRDVVESLEAWNAGLNAPQRPLAALLFLGPTGSGKTRLVEAVAERLLGRSDALVRINCGEFQQSHEIARLVGAPPGYLGHRETKPALSQEALDRCHSPSTKVSVVLFDEIEKAHENLRRMMLGILDKATLSMGDGGQADFSKALIFMTSNLGAREMAKDAQGGIGFAAPTSDSSAAHTKDIALRALRARFSPEFVNRIDRVAVFRRLDREDLDRVLELELNALRVRLARANVVVTLATTPAARNWLLERGTDTRFGARELKRVIDREVARPMAAFVSSRQLRPGLTVQVGVSRDRLVFDQEQRGVIARR